MAAKTKKSPVPTKPAAPKHPHPIDQAELDGWWAAVSKEYSAQKGNKK